MNPLEKLRRQYFPSEEEKQIQQLHKDLSTFEVNGWISSLIDYCAFDPRAFESDAAMPPDTIEVWRSLTEYQREMAFCFLLGAVKALIQPPQETGDYSSVNA